jgi:hypothetical protein
LVCAFGLKLAPCKGHKFHAPPEKPMETKDWSMCESSLPFLLPEKLPIFNDKETFRGELIDFLTQLLPVFEEPLTDELKQRFDDFLKANESYR